MNAAAQPNTSHQCGYAGCQRPPAYELTQRVGNHQVLAICACCAPAWGKAAPGQTKFYTVRVLRRADVRRVMS